MLQRKIAKNLAEARADTPVILLMGPRRAGKSTLAQQAALTPPGAPIVVGERVPEAALRQAPYFTLDDAATLADVRANPQGFLEERRASEWIVIDEVQRVPELMIAIKREVDLSHRTGSFLITGSANILTLPKTSETLAGRVELLRMWSLAQCEIENTPGSFLHWVFSDARDIPQDIDLQSHTRDSIIDRALAGGYPEVLARGTRVRRDAFFGSYLTTVIEREIKSISDIEDETGITRILKALASRSGGPRNYTTLSNDTQLPMTTIRRYAALLEATFLIKELPAWAGGVDGKIIRTPKMLITDSGLYGNLLNISPSDSHIGFLIETFVGTELLKLASFEGHSEYTLLHFRRKQHEVDFVIEQRGGAIVGVEVKAATTVRADDFSGLLTLASIAKDRFHRGILFYCGDKVVPFSNGTIALPISTLWQL